MSTQPDSGATSATSPVAGWHGDQAAVGHWSLDPSASLLSFQVKHFWGAVTVRGTFREFTGAGDLGPDGAVTGQLRIDAASLDTKNKGRDQHLRSGDFFGVAAHPEMLVTITGAQPEGPATLSCQGTLEAAGHTEPLAFTAELEDAGPSAVTLRVDLVVDRTHLGMAWNPLGMASKLVRATAVARFVRA
jgi:polyisoprenoid-binding protein YceI